MSNLGESLSRSLVRHASGDAVDEEDDCGAGEAKVLDARFATTPWVHLFEHAMRDTHGQALRLIIEKS